jgi:hypothetical protein
MKVVEEEEEEEEEAAAGSSRRSAQVRTARVRTIMSWKVRFSESHSGHR